MGPKKKAQDNGTPKAKRKKIVKGKIEPSNKMANHNKNKATEPKTKITKNSRKSAEQSASKAPENPKENIETGTDTVTGSFNEDGCGIVMGLSEQEKQEFREDESNCSDYQDSDDEDVTLKRSQSSSTNNNANIR